jgi:myo-inositol-1(or 4)-monophosphatase
MTAPAPEEIASRLKIALRAAEQAGAVLMRHYGKLDRIEEKSPVDLVTVADRESEATVLSELRAAFPRDAMLAEEADGRDGATAMRERVPTLPWCWVVDPLDGTTNFAHSHLNFCVSIGLLHFGQPALGVVLAPARREIFVGGIGVPATCNGRPISVSQVTTLAKSLVATGFPYDRRHRLPQLLAWLGRALERAHCVRRGGAAALDLCEVAAGRLDAFYEPGLAPWDLVGGCAIITAAGGQLSDFDGAPHDVFAGRTLASNGLVHSELIALVDGPDAPSWRPLKS